MGGTTTHGYPYVSPTDHPKEYPAASQALANAIDAANMSVGGITQGTASVPSSTTGSTAFTVSGTPVVWGGMTASTSFLLAPVAGRYRISFTVSFPTGSGGTIRAAWIWNNVGAIPGPAGQDQIAVYNVPSVNTTGIGNTLTGSGVWELGVGDMVRIYTRQDSGSSLACSGTLTVQLVDAL